MSFLSLQSLWWINFICIIKNVFYNSYRYKDSFSTNGKLTKWNIETGYSFDADVDSYPRRTLVSGVKGGLEIIFNVVDEDLDYICGDSLQGYKVW